MQRIVNFFTDFINHLIYKFIVDAFLCCQQRKVGPNGPSNGEVLVAGCARRAVFEDFAHPVDQIGADAFRPDHAALIGELLERETGPVTVAGSTVSFSVRPFEVKTLRVQLQGA